MNVLLMGGGMDSYAVLLYLVEKGINVTCVHIDYGQKSFFAERIACLNQVQHVNKAMNTSIKLVSTEDSLIFKLNPFGSYLFGNKDASPELKGRNLVLFMHAIGIVGYSGTVYMGLDKPYNGVDPFKDCTLPFFNNAIEMLDRSDIKIIAPFINMDKQLVVEWASYRDKEFLDRTMSCWDASLDGHEIVECGVCKHCKTKKELKEGCKAYV